MRNGPTSLRAFLAPILCLTLMVLSVPDLVGSTCNSILVHYTGDCNDGPDSFSPTNLASCVEWATDLEPINGNSNASCVDGVICIQSVPNPGWEFELTVDNELTLSSLEADFLYPVHDTGGGGSSNDNDCPNSTSYQIKIYKNGSLKHSSTGSIPEDEITTEVINISSPIVANNGDGIKVEILGVTNDEDCDLLELYGFKVLGCCGTPPPSCSDLLVDYSGDCNDGPDSFSPSNLASCVEWATDLEPINGNSNASCQDEVICIHTVPNPGWEFTITPNEELTLTTLEADFLYPVEDSGGGGSSNDDNCPNSIPYKVKFYKNGSLQHTHTGSIPKDVITTETIVLPTAIEADNGDNIKVEAPPKSGKLH